MSQVQPITPDEVVAAKPNVIPDGVFMAFNELITEKFNGRVAIIRQDEVIERILAESKPMGMDVSEARRAIFKRGWLNVEEVYREAGWRVTYDKPDYNETYEATYEFRKP